MGGPIGAFAEVIDAADEAFAEELLPETVHRDAGRQRIAAVSDPFGELEAAALPGRNGGELIPGGHAQGAAWHDGGGGIGVAAHVDGHVSRLLGVLHREGLRRLRLEEFGMLDLVVLLFQLLGEFVSPLGEHIQGRRGRGCRGGGDGGRLDSGRGGLGCGGFLKGGDFGADRFALGGQLRLFRFEGDDPGGMIGFGLLALRELGRCFRQGDAADGAPDADAFQFHGRGGATQHAGHAVVVFDADGIELVVMAAGATHRHAEEGPADLDELGVDMVRLHLGFVRVDDLDVADHQEARGDELLGALFHGSGRQEVAGELFLDEQVERFVLVEGLDEVVAVTPGMLGEDVVRGADHVGIPREIEPVAGPAFAVSRRGEQAVDDLGVGVGGLVFGEGDDFLGRGREAGEVEADASDPGMSVGIAGRLEAFGLDFLEEEAIERILRPGGVFDGGSGRISDRLEGPELASFLEIDGALRFGGLGRIACARVRCSPSHPFFEDGDFLRRQAAFRGHRKIFVEVAHRLDQEALRKVAGDDCRAVVAAFLPAGAAVEVEAALDLLFRRMTLIAAVDQHGSHLRLEEQIIVTGGQEGQRREQQ